MGGRGKKMPENKFFLMKPKKNPKILKPQYILHIRDAGGLAITAKVFTIFKSYIFLHWKQMETCPLYKKFTHLKNLVEL
jgi:hypothetical protein